MTAIAPEPNALADLPPMPETAEPLVMPGLLHGLGLSVHPVPAWITDPDLAASIACGLVEVPDDFNPQGSRR